MFHKKKHASNHKHQNYTNLLTPTNQTKITPPQIPCVPNEEVNKTTQIFIKYPSYLFQSPCTINKQITQFNRGLISQTNHLSNIQQRAPLQTKPISLTNSDYPVTNPNNIRHSIHNHPRSQTSPKTTTLTP